MCIYIYMYIYIYMHTYTSVYMLKRNQTQSSTIRIIPLARRLERSGVQLSRETGVSWLRSWRNALVIRALWNPSLDQNQSKNGKYILISVWFNKISKRFLCMYTRRKRFLNLLNKTKLGFLDWHTKRKLTQIAGVRLLWTPSTITVVWYTEGFQGKSSIGAPF